MSLSRLRGTLGYRWRQARSTWRAVRHTRQFERTPDTDWSGDDPRALRAVRLTMGEDPTTLALVPSALLERTLPGPTRVAVLGHRRASHLEDLSAIEIVANLAVRPRVDVVSHLDDGAMHLREIPEAIPDRTDALVITSPSLAASILLLPGLLERVRERVRRLVAFPAVHWPSPIAWSWDEGFSQPEHLGARSWRWVEGPLGTASLRLLNLTASCRRLSLYGQLWFAPGAGEEVQLRCRGQFATWWGQQHDRELLRTFLPPGESLLEVRCLGESVRAAEHDPRRVSVRVVDPRLLGAGGAVLASGPQALSSATLSSLHLSSPLVRQRLHDASFFEVSAYAETRPHVEGVPAAFESLIPWAKSRLGHHDHPLENTAVADGAWVWWIADRCAIPKSSP